MQSLFKIIACILVIVILLIGSILFIVKSGIIEPIHVGVNFEENDGLTKLLLQYVFQMDSLKNICDYEIYSDDEIEDKVKNNTIQVGLIFPDDFFEDVNSGENTPIKVLLADNIPLNRGVVFSEMIIDGVYLVEKAEASVYAMYDAIHAVRPYYYVYGIGDEVCTDYAYFFLDRGKIFSDVICSPIGDLYLPQYIFICLTIVLIMLISLLTTKLYGVGNDAFILELRRNGIGHGIYSTIKIVIMAIIFSIFILSFYGIAAIALYFTQIEGFYLNGGMFIGVIVTSILSATFVQFLYEIIGDAKALERALFLIYIFMIICSGVIIPASYLPEVIALFGGILPVSIIAELLAVSFFEAGSGVIYIYAFSFIVGMILVSEVMAWKKS